MIKTIKHLLKEGLVSNLALGLIVLPTGASSNLIIPQTNLDLAFNIPSATNDDTAPKIQIPTNFIYMSQGFSSFHPAIDLATIYGNPIEPIMTGTVEFAGYSPFGYGNEVLIDNGNGIESLYAHLSKIEVKQNEYVGLNSEIGLVGTSGHATGPHLHLEVHKNGVPINPVSFLPTLKTAQTLTFNDDIKKEAPEKEKTTVSISVNKPEVSIEKPVNNLITKLPVTISLIQQ